MTCAFLDHVADMLGHKVQTPASGDIQRAVDGMLRSDLLNISSLIATLRTRPSTHELLGDKSHPNHSTLHSRNKYADSTEVVHFSETD